MPLLNQLKFRFRAFWPTCRQAGRLQSDALDRKPAFGRRIGLFVHLLVCKWCRRYGRQLRFLRGAMQKRAEDLIEALPAQLNSEARERIKCRIEAKIAEKHQRDAGGPNTTQGSA